ncbi:MAG: hypothetical protein ACOCYF_01480 [Bacteroidota bacterium]
MKNLFLISLILILLLALPPAFSQNNGNGEKNNKKTPPKERIFFGGNFNIAFGTNYANIEISPIVGYHLTSRLELATGPIYMYFKDQLFADYNTHIFGGRIYTRYHVIKNIDNILPLNTNLGIFGHAEYAGLSLENQYFGFDIINEGRFWDHNVLVGGGIRQPIGGKAYIFISFLYNLDEDYGSLYSSPVVRFGLIF